MTIIYRCTKSVNLIQSATANDRGEREEYPTARRPWTLAAVVFYDGALMGFMVAYGLSHMERARISHMRKTAFLHPQIECSNHVTLIRARSGNTHASRLQNVSRGGNRHAKRQLRMRNGRCLTKSKGSLFTLSKCLTCVCTKSHAPEYNTLTIAPMPHYSPCKVDPSTLAHDTPTYHRFRQSGSCVD